MHPDKREILEAILKRPALYFDENHSFLRSLDAFDLGYDFGFRKASGNNSAPQSIYPEGLATFIISKLGHDSTRPAWIYRIEDSTDSDEEAFNLFKELYYEFTKEVDKLRKTGGPIQS